MLPGPALIETLDRRFGNVWISHDGAQINVSCPFCPKRGKGTDTSGHLGLNFLKNGGVYHCVRCDAGGKLKSFLDRNHVEHSLRAMTISEVANLRTTISRLRNDEQAPYVPPTLDMTKFPKARNIVQEDFDQSSVFGDSLKKKNISLDEAQRHCMCACEDGKEKGYVIFPFFEAVDEPPVYWQGRDATGEAYLRKLNPSALACPQGKAHWLYNFEYAVRGGELYLVEGTLDAATLQTWLEKNRGEGHTALAVQGTALSFPAFDVHPLNTQYGKLVGLHPTKVHVVFDADAWVKSQELANVLSTCGLNAHPVRLVGGDPNEIGDGLGTFFNAGRSLTEMLKHASF